MIDRRRFLISSIGAGLGISVPACTGKKSHIPFIPVEGPVIISTWKHGIPANQKAWKMLSGGGSVLDAVEAAVMIAEADPYVSSVGYGGLPDSSGEVTLDACIMDQFGNAGSVTCLKQIIHPISVARLVMEKTPHVMLTGEGALRFALQQGFQKTDLLSPEAREEWKKHMAAKSREEQAEDIMKGHDTIGLIARDGNGNFAGACTTSGMGFKMPGRVGDSPIIGA